MEKKSFRYLELNLRPSQSKRIALAAMLYITPANSFRTGNWHNKMQLK